ncbi:hypothetical protein [Streptomyces sp. V3I7]|uniref:hypothetical protein n=1 Tax=Streptomyces sp. V3I7 TaxID=3042278 RepID=UPI0027855D4D|nr:hypothetical protein [Streptomyces sp. V3I7]MDQ0992941.1 DNA-directed RNA polymerase subunit RPC12/RpoP [Streptomyces sp. V3I7]
MTSLPGDSDHDSRTTESDPVVCARCGAQAQGPQPTWSCSVENERRRYFCDTCARENLRAIEGRLDSTWW